MFAPFIRFALSTLQGEAYLEGLRTPPLEAEIYKLKADVKTVIKNAKSRHLRAR